MLITCVTIICLVIYGFVSRNQYNIIYFMHSAYSPFGIPKPIKNVKPIPLQREIACIGLDPRVFCVADTNMLVSKKPCGPNTKLP